MSVTDTFRAAIYGVLTLITVPQAQVMQGPIGDGGWSNLTMPPGTIITGCVFVQCASIEPRQAQNIGTYHDRIAIMGSIFVSHRIFRVVA